MTITDGHFVARWMSEDATNLLAPNTAASFIERLACWVDRPLVALDRRR